LQPCYHTGANLPSFKKTSQPNLYPSEEQNEKVGLSEDADVKPPRERSSSLGGLLSTLIKLLLFFSYFPSDLKSGFGDTKAANAQVPSRLATVNPKNQPESFGGRHEKEFPEGALTKTPGDLLIT